MAEYITKEQVMEIYENAYFSAEDIQELRYYFETFINCAVPAEVIEREEYDLLKRQLADSWDRIDELDKLNGHMREQINKTIEEITEYSKNASVVHARIAFNKVLETLKENIGE